MSFTEIVPYVDLIGYLGGGVTLWSLYQKTMIPLRLGAVIGSGSWPSAFWSPATRR